MELYARILIVEDDLIAGFIYQTIFSKLDPSVEVVTRTDGREALSYLAKQLKRHKKLPDAILIDLHMPRVDGWEFLSQFQELVTQYGNYHLPMIWLISSDSSPEVFKKALNDPMINKFMQKPFRMEDASKLIHLIQRQNEKI